MLPRSYTLYLPDGVPTESPASSIGVVPGAKRAMYEHGSIDAMVKHAVPVHLPSCMLAGFIPIKASDTAHHRISCSLIKHLWNQPHEADNIAKLYFNFPGLKGTRFGGTGQQGQCKIACRGITSSGQIFISDSHT